MKQKAENSRHATIRYGIALSAAFVGAFALTGVGTAAASSDGWSLKLSPYIGTQQATAVTLGEFGDALDGFDFKYDAPVVELNSGLATYFPRTEWGTQDQHYWIDIQSKGAQRIWPLTARSSVQGKKLRLDWNPADLPAGHTAVMTDTFTGRRIDMTSQGAYAFYNHNGDARRFSVMVSDPALDGCPDEDFPGLDADGDGCKDADGVDLRASITGSADTAVVGDKLNYEVEVRNDGSLNAEGVVLSAVVPSNAEFVSATGSCSLATAKVICDLGGLPSGSATSLELVMRATGTGLLTSRVEAVTSSAGDPDEADNRVAYRTQVNQLVASQQPGGGGGGTSSGGGGGGSGGGAFDPFSTLALAMFAAVAARRRRRETIDAQTAPCAQPPAGVTVGCAVRTGTDG